ncbi:MAG: mRNA surveillance protein Pelota, partial [Candidatus Woesearchaeota archaeon]
MKIEHADYRYGEIKIRVENKDDLWYLSQIVDIGDSCSGRTFRKIKVGSDENAKTIKKAAFLEICVEKIEFHNFSGNLRLSGKILVGTEEIPQGQYHTFDVEEDSVISLKKEKFYKYQIEKIKE